MLDNGKEESYDRLSGLWPGTSFTIDYFLLCCPTSAMREDLQSIENRFPAIPLPRLLSSSQRLKIRFLPDKFSIISCV